jgi:hypothetical protein
MWHIDLKGNTMATPSEKLATSVEVLKKLQNDMGMAVIKSNDISRTQGNP